MLDTDLVTGVTAALPLPVSIDAGAPFSAFPPMYDTVANKHKLPEGVRIPPPMLKEPLSIDSKAIEIGYVRLPVLNYGTVAFKKPVFAVSLTEGETILPKERYFGVLGARNLRDNIIRFDYVNSRIKIFKLAEIEAREFFLSTLDDLQARHFATPESERVLLYENLKRGAHETGNVNVEVLAHILWTCLPTVRRAHEHDPIAVGNSYDEMDLKVQLSRDRVAFGLFKALWCTKGCARFDDHGMVRQLQNAERRAPEHPYILTRLAEAYININQSVTAAQCLTTALKIDPGFEDALRLAEKLAERAADRERTEQIKEARQFYHSIK